MKRFFIISVDVEGVPLKDGSMDYSTIVDGVPLLFDLFDEFNIHPTFFVTSDTAQNVTDVIKEIARLGHEIGCHEFGDKEYEKLKEATAIINKYLGVAPFGFRAHRHKISCETLVSLAKLGYKYDSSVISSSRLFNKDYSPRAPKNPYHPSFNNICEKGDSPLIEIPISALPLIKLPLALSYIKLFGLGLYKLFLPRLYQETILMYMHPYDLFQQQKEVDAPLNFALAHRRRADGLKVLRSLLNYLEEKFSPTYIRARDILDRNELVSRGGVEPSISTM